MQWHNSDSHCSGASLKQHHYVSSRLCIVCNVTSNNAASDSMNAIHCGSAITLRKKIHKRYLNYYFLKIHVLVSSAERYIHCVPKKVITSQIS